MNPNDPAVTTASVGRCSSCGKRTYLTRRAAKHVSRTAHHDNLRAYRCPHNPEVWHIGHNAAWKIRGETPRHAL